MKNSTEAPAVLGPVERQVRPRAPVAEVVCYETPRYGKPPMQTYELRQHEPFRALQPGTHQLYTQVELTAAIDAERDFWREEGADDQGHGVVDEAALAVRQLSDVHGYATRLATAIHAKHFAEVTQWNPLPNALGVLTQIDNMTSGLVMRERAPLSTKELLRMYDDCGSDWCKVARAVEAAHGIGA